MSDAPTTPTTPSALETPNTRPIATPPAAASTTAGVSPEGGPSAALPSLEADGFTAAVDAYAWEQDADAGTPRMRLWFLSMLGPQQSVKALWVRLVRGEVATMRFGAEGGLGRARFCALAPEGPRSWRFFAAALPASAGHHAVLAPEAALYTGERPHFVVLPRAAEDAAALHYRFLNRRVDLPLHPWWAGWLWSRAVATGEATALEARGLTAYRCVPDVEALAADLSAAVRAGALAVPDAGAPTAAPAAAMALGRAA
jgi:hypothetical protein